MRQIHAQVWQTVAEGWTWTLYTDGEAIEEGRRHYATAEAAEDHAMVATIRHIERYPGSWDIRPLIRTPQPVY